ncbi:hypothetical protein [Saccharibacillus sacchari]|uniref:Uncharacterized protein n=1 Tax=Saccharibacillus sacchari TaxID=456493 RepID=A0ACC6PEM9_9BACL
MAITGRNGAQIMFELFRRFFYHRDMERRILLDPFGRTPDAPRRSALRLCRADRARSGSLPIAQNAEKRHARRDDHKNN